MTYGPFPAVVTEIHDGDTFHLDIDLGFGLHAREFRCRLLGINAPELKTDAGVKALEYLESILPLGAEVRVTSHHWDKYGGRFDGDVLYGNVDIAQAMLRAGHAVVMR